MSCSQDINIYFFEKKINLKRENINKNTTNKTMCKRQSKEKSIE